MCCIKTKETYFLFHLMTAFVGFIIYVVCFASVGWIKDGDMSYGLWKRCPNGTSDSSCETLTLAAYDGYFEASRTLLTVTLVFFILSLVFCMSNDTFLDRGCKKFFFTWGVCVMLFLGVIMAVVSMALIGTGIQEDDDFDEPEIRWAFYVCAVACFINLLSAFFRVGFVVMLHDLDCDDCCDDCRDCVKRICRRRKLRKTKPAESKPKAVVLKKRKVSSSSSDSSDSGSPAKTETSGKSGPKTLQQGAMLATASVRFENEKERRERDEQEMRDSNKQYDSSLPVATYDYAAEPSSDMSVAPPPSYHVAVSGNILTDLAPPPVAKPKNTSRTSAMRDMIKKWRGKSDKSADTTRPRSAGAAGPQNGQDSRMGGTGITGEHPPRRLPALQRRTTVGHGAPTQEDEVQSRGFVKRLSMIRLQKRSDQ